MCIEAEDRQEEKFYVRSHQAVSRIAKAILALETTQTGTLSEEERKLLKGQLHDIADVALFNLSQELEQLGHLESAEVLAECIWAAKVEMYEAWLDQASTGLADHNPKVNDRSTN
jgi:hypothetical protein